MYPLRINHDWASQIQTIRDACTEDTNLIRFDNSFYRICRAGTETFQVQLLPRDAGHAGITLLMRCRDLYVTHVDGRPFETYAQTLDRKQPQPLALDNAVMALPKALGTRLFELQSIVVLCVAESLRNDHMATLIGQVIRTSTTGLLGARTSLPVAQMLAEAHTWGQTSEAVLAALSPAARDIVLRRRLHLTPLQRQFSERVDLTRVDARVRDFARSVKVLKRPG